ncbi:MAG: CDP-diacylglycerol--glycerol-3-phosphate 3-phosphatidyltransferase, partial [Candidatus Omnitrophica bacterium]|nr:CDP-diacylglycerol--glycerol-3-phosphate 3-phosphatidyltransferase [Candidatus Omnitrophota bacterium]
MNLPNRLTVLRIILTFIFMFLLFSEGLLAKIMALVVFTLACVSDFFDGYLARKYNLITDLGKLLDPLADKILVLSAYLASLEMRIIAAWMVAIIILRELIISGVRFLATSKGKILAAAKAGKHKTVSQMVSIFIILAYIIIKEICLGFNFWNAKIEFWVKFAIYLLMLITVALTVISGIFYLKENRGIFKNAKNS